MPVTGNHQHVEPAQLPDNNKPAAEARSDNQTDNTCEPQKIQGKSSPGQLHAMQTRSNQTQESPDVPSDTDVSLEPPTSPSLEIHVSSGRRRSKGKPNVNAGRKKNKNKDGKEPSSDNDDTDYQPGSKMEWTEIAHDKGI